MTYAYYLAGLLSRKDELRRYAEQIAPFGDEVTARWLYRPGDHVRKPGEPRLDYTSPEPRLWANEDLADVGTCDTFVLFTEERGVPQPGGGRFVEFGYALALGKRLVIIGEVENLFLGMRRVEHFADWASFVSDEWGMARVGSPIRASVEEGAPDGGDG